MIKITVFTPTYNRLEKLKRCYNSLLAQTNKEFEWLIIDDGSTDDTKKWVKSILKNSPFKINYIFQQNGGKHRAHNLAVKNCFTDYILILDSDDILSESCINVLYAKIKIIDAQKNISGIIGNKFDLETKKCIGTKMPASLSYITGISLYQKYKFKGDTLRFYKTAILKKFLFPEILGEKFIYENVVFDRIDQNYKMLIIFDELYYCEYNMDGYSKNSAILKMSNPIGYSLSLKSASETAVSIIKKNNWAILYFIWCRKFKIKYDIALNKMHFLVLLLISYVFEILKIPKFFFSILK